MPVRPEDKAGRFKISLKTAERIAEVWPDATSLSNAMHRAGLKVTDKRNMNRYRRDAEALLNIKLPPHNPEFSTETEVECPSFLDVKKAKQAKAFVITSAVNNTNLNDRFFDTLELFAEKNKAQILVVPQKYRHNTLIGGQNYKWPKRIYDYALLDDLIVNKSLVISSLKLQASAVNPLSGLAPNSGHRSAIYGATKVALECVPTPGNSAPKIMATTGACTSATYTKTKAGGKAKFHHSISALFVRVVGQGFHLTQLHWCGKGIYYLDEYYTPEGVTAGHRALALVQGDSHAAYTEKALIEARRRLIDRTDPESLVWHDSHDHRIGSHHNTMLDKVRLAERGLTKIEDELNMALDLIETEGKGRMNLIAGSNHDDALDKHINRFDANKDPVNAMLMWDLSQKVIETGKPAFQCWLEPRLTVKAKFLDRNKAYMVGSIDVSQHGDVGAGGSRGSIGQFSKYSVKTVIGHSHRPGIKHGAYQVGVSTMKMEYNKGYSAWAYCDCLIYKNSKRALIFYHNYKSLTDL